MEQCHQKSHVEEGLKSAKIVSHIILMALLTGFWTCILFSEQKCPERKQIDWK